MPVAPTYPGVYIQELPSGVHTITGVATSIAAFVGRAAMGPTDEATEIGSFADYQRLFGGLSNVSPMSFAVRDFYSNGGTDAIIVRIHQDKTKKAALDTANAVGKAASAADALAAITTQAGTYPSDPEKSAATAVLNAAKTAAAVPGSTAADVLIAATAAATATAGSSVAAIQADTLALVASSPGSWGNNLRACVDRKFLSAADQFNLYVRNMATGDTETFLALTVNSGQAQSADTVLARQSTLVRVSGALPGAAPKANDDPDPGRGVWDDSQPSGNKTFYPVTTTADDGSWLTVANFTGGTSYADKTGLYALRKADLFNLLCIPPFLADGGIDKSMIDDAVAFCRQSRAVLLIDPPPGWKTKDDAKTKLGTDVGSATSYAALFFPRVKEANPLHNSAIETFAPCGVVAGVIARTDAQRGVWKAPAGLDATLAGVTDLALALTDTENGELNPKGINCLRVRPAAGPVVWGARTREGDDRLASEYKYLPVRRLALFIEESLYRGTQWVVFEPNDEPLWAQVRLNVGAFMQGLFRQGAFQGATPADAYFVKCSSETTTQTDINNGIVNIVVGFAPLKPAEFVVIQLQQIAGQIVA